MEEKLLELFKLANTLGEKSNKVYVYITYSADNLKTLEISLRSKKDFSYIERCHVQLRKHSIISLDNIIELLQCYIDGGDTIE